MEPRVQGIRQDFHRRFVVGYSVPSQTWAVVRLLNSGNANQRTHYANAQLEKRQLLQEEAILRAEARSSFVVANGYTDLPPRAADALYSFGRNLSGSSLNRRHHR